MRGARSYQTEAIIVKKTKLGEADRILTLYTPGMGKVQAVAKGVRRPRSKLSGHLELLTYSRVMLTKGRNLDTITGSQTIDGFLPLKNNLELCACALYATELVHLFGVDRQENRPLFTLLLEVLRHLSTCDGPPATYGLLRYFDVRLLDTVGYRPQLEQCVVCRRPASDTAAYFSLASGGAVCPECRAGQSYAYAISHGTLEALKTLQAGDWSSAGGVSPDPRIRRDTERLLRNYLRYVLEREIRSAAWLDTLARLRSQSLGLKATA